MSTLVTLLAELSGPGLKRELRWGVEDGLLYIAALVCSLIGAAFGLVVLFMVLEQYLGMLETLIVFAALGFFASACLLLLIARRRRHRMRVRAAARSATSSDMALFEMALGVLAASPMMTMALGAGIAAAGFVTRKRSGSR